MVEQTRSGRRRGRLVLTGSVLALATLTARESSAVVPTRYIPLRVVQLVDCNPVCQPAVPTTVLRDSVARANEVYAPAGIKFWVWSNEVFDSPNFESYEGTADYRYWFQVRDEIRAIYPSIPSNAWEDGTIKRRNAWLDAAAVFYAAPAPVQVFVHNDPGGQSSALYPWNGRSLQMRSGSFVAEANPNDPTDVVTTVLGHELGHYFGLVHPFATSAWSSGEARDPTTCDPWVAADDWDLLRCTSTFPYRTFNSRSDFVNYGCLGEFTYFLDTGAGQYCRTGPAYTGRLLCDYAPEPIPGDTLDATTTGMAFENPAVPDNPPWSFRYGINLMNYYSPTQTDRRAPAFLSPSQRAKLDKWLTAECWWGTLNVSEFVRMDGAWPFGSSSYSNYTLRSQVDTDSRTLWAANAAPGMEFTFKASATDALAGHSDAVAGDFDGDGFEDILAFSPGNTSVKIRWGSTSPDSQAVVFQWFFTAPATFTKVFVGDFNGDGRDDVFVYGAGALLDYIRFGFSRTAFTQANYSVSGSYVPFAGNFDGAYGDDIFWYYPSGGFVHRWYSTGGATFQQANYYSVDAGGPYTPIVGNFDGAYGDDVFWYVSGAAQDRLWYSTNTTGFVKTSATNVSGAYQAVAGDFDGDGRDDIYWHTASRDRDFIWPGRDQPTQFGSSIVSQMYFARQPLAGNFVGDSRSDLYWR